MHPCEAGPGAPRTLCLPPSEVDCPRSLGLLEGGTLHFLGPVATQGVRGVEVPVAPDAPPATWPGPRSPVAIVEPTGQFCVLVLEAQRGDCLPGSALRGEGS